MLQIRNLEDREMVRESHRQTFCQVCWNPACVWRKCLKICLSLKREINTWTPEIWHSDSSA